MSMNSFLRSPYFQFNIAFAGVILLILGYSGLFSANGLSYPIHSAHPNQELISTGLSRAFSEIVRFNFQQARAYNPYSISLFLFFFSQFLIRMLTSIILFSKRFSQKLVLISDILISVLLFLCTFGKFIVDQL